VIDNNRVIRFGCHLPLSASAAQHGNLGLRHTAALGLSERSDAICIVVSEERGTISLAKGERIMEIANASALRIELEAFFAKRAPLAKPTDPPLAEGKPAEKMMPLFWPVFFGLLGYQRR